MNNDTPERNRENCFNILNEFTKTPGLILHALSVEACVKFYAEKFGEDVNYWGNAGLLHDFDYEMFPTEEEHPYKGAEILRGRGFGDDFIDTILSHTGYTGVPRDTQLRKVLYACDELSGFITAMSKTVQKKGSP